MKPFEPMLAVKADLEKLRFPLIASPKLDGIRCVYRNGEVLSRTLEAIPNEYIQSTLKGLFSRYPSDFEFDGEIITFTMTEEGKEPDDFNTIQSKVMRQDGDPSFDFWVFDTMGDPEVPYMERLNNLEVLNLKAPAYRLEYTFVNDLKELQDLEDAWINTDGEEGIMLRDPNAPYKYGRSTMKEQGLLKHKLFSDAEAKVVGFQELMSNQNEAETNNVGRTKRSSSKAGKVPTGTLGALLLETEDGTKFKVGSGFDAALRRDIWESRETYLGKLVTYRFQEMTPKGKPRFPTFVGFRFDL